MWRTDLFEKPLCWERLKAEGEGDDRGWDGWMTSLTQWTWVLLNSESCWWTGRPGVLQFMGLQRVGHNWATELNWIWELLFFINKECLKNITSLLLPHLIYSYIMIIWVFSESDLNYFYFLVPFLYFSVNGFDFILFLLWSMDQFLSLIFQVPNCFYWIFLKK